MVVTKVYKDLREKISLKQCNTAFDVSDKTVHVKELIKAHPTQADSETRPSTTATDDNERVTSSTPDYHRSSRQRYSNNAGMRRSTPDFKGRDDYYLGRQCSPNRRRSPARRRAKSVAPEVYGRSRRDYYRTFERDSRPPSHSRRSPSHSRRSPSHSRRSPSFGRSVSRSKSVGRLHPGSSSRRRVTLLDTRYLDRRPSEEYDHHHRPRRPIDRAHYSVRPGDYTRNGEHRTGDYRLQCDKREPAVCESSHESTRRRSETKPTEPKQLFLIANKYTVAMLIDREYSVFNIQKNKSDNSVTEKSSWALRMAMYPSTENDGKKCTTRYLVHKYAASKCFIASLLNDFLNENRVKLYTTVQTSKQMTETFSRVKEYGALKEKIQRLEAGKMYDVRVLKPQRRSSVCLFRPHCVKRHECVYCQLETLNNRVNVQNGIRATKDTDIGEQDRGILDKIVSGVASKNGSKSRSSSSVTSSSSSSSSSSSDSSSSSSDSSSDEDDDALEKKPKDCGTPVGKKEDGDGRRRKTDTTPTVVPFSPTKRKAITVVVDEEKNKKKRNEKSRDVSEPPVMILRRPTDDQKKSSIAEHQRRSRSSRSNRKRRSTTRSPSGPYRGGRSDLSRRSRSRTGTRSSRSRSPGSAEEEDT